MILNSFYRKKDKENAYKNEPSKNPKLAPHRFSLVCFIYRYKEHATFIKTLKIVQTIKRLQTQTRTNQSTLRTPNQSKLCSCAIHNITPESQRFKPYSKNEVLLKT